MYADPAVLHERAVDQLVDELHERLAALDDLLHPTRPTIVDHQALRDGAAAAVRRLLADPAAHADDLLDALWPHHTTRPIPHVWLATPLGRTVHDSITRAGVHAPDPTSPTAAPTVARSSIAAMPHRSH
jgi:hypothetical protein